MCKGGMPLNSKKENEKQHTTVNNLIMKLDETLKLSGGSDTTFFLSINDDDSQEKVS